MAKAKNGDRTLTTNVSVVNPDTGASETYGPESEQLPAWFADQVTNPKVWSDFDPTDWEDPNGDQVVAIDGEVWAKTVADARVGDGTIPGVGTGAADDFADVDPSDLGGSTHERLKEYAAAKGVDTSGSKAKLVDRLEEAADADAAGV